MYDHDSMLTDASSMHQFMNIKFMNYDSLSFSNKSFKKIHTNQSIDNLNVNVNVGSSTRAGTE